MVLLLVKNNHTVHKALFIQMASQVPSLRSPTSDHRQDGARRTDFKVGPYLQERPTYQTVKKETTL